MPNDFDTQYGAVRGYKASEEMHKTRAKMSFEEAMATGGEMEQYDIEGKQEAGGYLGRVVGGGIRDAAESVRSKNTDAGFGQKTGLMMGAPALPSSNELPGAPDPNAPLGEALPRGIVQFMSIYGPAKAMLTGGRIVTDMAAGAVADFTAFKNKEGNLSDMARELGIDNDLTRFLSGELSDTEFEASFKTAIEGAAFGAAIYAIPGLKRTIMSSYRWARDNPEFRNRVLDFLGGQATPRGAMSRQKGEILNPFAAPEPLATGRHATTTAGRIRNKTEAQQGYTVQMETGEIPEEGILMGKFSNESGKNLILEPGEKLTKPVLDKWVGANAKALSRVENHLGTWKEEATGKTYVDLSTMFGPDEIRKATKFGERTGQKAGFNVGKMEETPVGNWEEFVNSPQFESRMMEMQKVGKDYLAKHATDEWWDIHGTVLEEVYGRENLEQVAGFIAATAPNTNPTQNMRMASEYMRRHLIGEDIVQPDWRVPAGTQTRTEGVQIGMEAGRKRNLEAAERGDIGELRSDKVRSEAQALLGDPDAAVFDRWWARIAEDAESGVFTATQEGAFEAARKTFNQYEELHRVVSEAAASQGRSVRDFSADVWTGIRETVKATDELFGAKYQGSALTGESKGYADIFTDLIKSKAEFLGITVEKFKDRLSKGDAELLSLIIGTPLGAHVYGQVVSGDSSSEPERRPGTSRFGDS